MTLMYRVAMVFGFAMRVFGACDLQVNVFDYDGHPRDAVVRVERSSELIRELRTKQGRARFCDLGLGYFSIIVGGPQCGQVRISMLQPIQGKTLTIPVFYKNCHGFTIYSGCTVLLRVKDHNGVPIPGASVTVGRFLGKADESGRVYVPGPVEVYPAVIRAEGYVEAKVKIGCGPQLTSVEQNVVLSRD